MVPVAPGRLSTTNGWPSVSVNRLAITRATTSLEPPGGQVTTMRTGFTGYACAGTVVGIEVSTAASTTAAGIALTAWHGFMACTPRVARDGPAPTKMREAHARTFSVNRA